MSGVHIKKILATVGITTILFCFIIGRRFINYSAVEYLAVPNIYEDSVDVIRVRNFSDIEFTKDYEPRENMSRIANETIHICITIGGASAAQEAKFLLTSLYIHSLRKDLHFHLLVTDDAKSILQKTFNEFKQPAVNIFYEFVKFDPQLIRKKAHAVKVKITHHSGVFGMSKAFMYKIFQNVDKCLILDTASCIWF